MRERPDEAEFGCDTLIRPFLEATTSAEMERALRHLLETEAAPVIRRVLQGKFRQTGNNLASTDAANDFEDVFSSAREELIRQLTLLRTGERTEPIANFRAYSGAVAYAVWAEHLRRAYPARSMLLNRLRYLLENRTNRRGFALWETADGERWCGLAEWKDHTGPTVNDWKLQKFMIEPVAAAAEALGTRNFREQNLATLVTRIFSWLGQPIALRHFLEGVAEVLEITDRKQSLDALADQNSPLPAVDPAASPIETLKWREYLQWLWTEMRSLTLEQRSAFLFHSEVTRDFEIFGIASIRQIASALQISAHDLATIWNVLPLPDLDIAKRLKLERQQIINLRRVARDRLGAAWKKWLN
jgi:hypothetical protein